MHMYGTNLKEPVPSDLTAFEVKEFEQISTRRTNRAMGTDTQYVRRSGDKVGQ